MMDSELVASLKIEAWWRPRVHWPAVRLRYRREAFLVEQQIERGYGGAQRARRDAEIVITRADDFLVAAQMFFAQQEPTGCEAGAQALDQLEIDVPQHHDQIVIGSEVIGLVE